MHEGVGHEERVRGGAEHLQAEVVAAGFERHAQDALVDAQGRDLRVVEAEHRAAVVQVEVAGVGCGGGVDLGSGRHAIADGREDAEVHIGFIDLLTGDEDGQEEERKKEGFHGWGWMKRGG